MMSFWRRREFLKIAAATLPAHWLGPVAGGSKISIQGSTMQPSLPPVSDLFPTQLPELAREMVMVAHFNLNRVKELV